MYTIFKEKDAYGIAFDGEAVMIFTEDLSVAENTVKILNDCDAERCHAADIIEDIIFGN